MRSSLIILFGLLPILYGGSSCAWSQPDQPKDAKKEKQVFVRVEPSRQSWLGVSLTDMTTGLAKEKGIKADEGAYIREVIEDSPAEKAGFEKGDVIVEFNGRTIYDADDLTKAVHKAEVGATVKAVVLRKDQKKTMEVKLGKAPRGSLARAYSFGIPATPQWTERSFRVFSGTGGDFSGLSLETLNPQLAEYFEVPGGEGVLVERVKKGSSGAKAGFKAGDVILKVGDTDVSEVEDVWEATGNAEKQDKAQVEILRKGKKMTLAVEIEQKQWKRRGHSEIGDEGLDIHIDAPEQEMEMRHNGLRLQGLREELQGLGREIHEKMRDAQRNLREALRHVRETTL